MCLKTLLQDKSPHKAHGVWEVLKQDKFAPTADSSEELFLHREGSWSGCNPLTLTGAKEDGSQNGPCPSLTPANESATVTFPSSVLQLPLLPCLLSFKILLIFRNCGDGNFEMTKFLPSSFKVGLE